MNLYGDVLFDANDFVAEFVRSRIPTMDKPFVNVAAALGVVRGPNLVGGIVYHDYVGHDINASGAFTTLRWWKPETVQKFFIYPFVTLKCKRISMTTAKDNLRARRMIERLGFKQEGEHPLGIGGTHDAISYGMLSRNCDWLR